MFSALAPAGSQTAQYESIIRQCTIGTFTTVRYSGTSSTIGGTNRVAMTRPLSTREKRGRRTASAKPAVVATTICTAHDPNAMTSVLSR